MGRAEIRRRVVSALSNGSMGPGALQDMLFDLESREVARELRELVRRNAVTHNGKVGRGSRYSRAA